MSEDESRKLESQEHAEDEVEAHHGGKHKLAHDEGSAEEGEDFELHHGGKHKLANDEGSTEGGDDFELHARRTQKRSM